jgi:hypothetical protein
MLSLAQVVVDSPKTPTTDSLFNKNSKNENQINNQRNDSPISQVRSYVEKQMDQLQQDLEFGFSRTPKSPLSPPSSTNLPTNTTRVFLHLISNSSFSISRS